MGDLKNAINKDMGLKCGIYMYNGHVTKKELGDLFDLPSMDINLLLI